MKVLLAWDVTTDTSIKPERKPVIGEWARHPDGVRKQYTGTPVPRAATPTRIITSRAFKKRLFVTERDAIRASTDPYVKDIWFDLNDSGYVDLDDDDLALGIAYVTNYLTTIPSFQNANVMTVINPSTRLTELLINGDEFEKYNGVL